MSPSLGTGAGSGTMLDPAVAPGAKITWERQNLGKSQLFCQSWGKSIFLPNPSFPRAQQCCHRWILSKDLFWVKVGFGARFLWKRDRRVIFGWFGHRKRAWRKGRDTKHPGIGEPNWDETELPVGLCPQTGLRGSAQWGCAPKVGAPRASSFSFKLYLISI